MISKKFSAKMLSAVVGALLVTAVPAQLTYAATSSLESLLTHVDRNKDGMVSKQEFLKRAGEMFDKMDKAKKGMMSMDVAHTATDKALEMLLVHTPPNADGMVTKDAFMKHAEEMFDKMGADKKGMTMSAYKKFIQQLSASDG